MAFEQLWAGWRSSYVGSLSAGPPSEPVEDVESPTAAQEDCVFCRIIASHEPDSVRHVVWSGSLTAAILNAFPYASGHLLVMPIRHVAEVENLEEAEAAELWSAARDAIVALKTAYSPEGLNLGINLGRAAGAGIPGHLHIHALPRWAGDTSFVTSVASLRVIPESLSETWEKVRAAWPATQVS
jgi:ATP adenylyltransferase